VSRIRRQPAFADALLNEAMELFLTGEAVAARTILWDLTSGLLGFDRLAQITGRPSDSLRRMLSASGNPGMDALSTILSQLSKAIFQGKPTVRTEAKLMVP
jgi:DNA-binding phage protein